MDPIRKAFEDVTAQAFMGDDCVYDYQRLKKLYPRKPSGEYNNSVVEDHWQTFQEGWEEAVKYLTNRDNPCYTDVVSNGGMDPRS
jgi:hypothetical protein